jgi:hypothetical protein
VLCKLIDRVLVGIRGEGGVSEMMSILAATAMRRFSELLNKLLRVDLAGVSLVYNERRTNVS